jgi:hypothetical protein
VTFPVTPGKENVHGSMKFEEMSTNSADTMTGITSDRRGPVPPPAFELSNLDAVRWLQDQPSESVDLLITDLSRR